MNDHAQFAITGVDGSQWVVHGPGSEASPVQLEQSSVGELFDAPVQTFRKARVGQPGTTYMGRRFLERNITLDLTSVGATGREWARIDSSLRRAFDYDEPATLTCTTEISGARRLKLRLEKEPEYREDLDPHALRVGRWTFHLVADDPFWLGETYHDEFVFDGLNWYGDGVTVKNPGDVPVWPEWVLTAPAKFILPDVSFTDPTQKTRQVALPFQPLKRDVVVNTDPLEEMIVANDDTLLWAQMGGQFFTNPIPPHTLATEVPVSVDPLPMIPWVVPDEWRMWIAHEIAAWAKRLGMEEVMRRTPNDVADEIKRILKASTPQWVADVTPDWLEDITRSAIADAITTAWGSVGNMAGATAQLRLQFRWSRPWGLE